jgi:hypothetical protein
MDREVLLEPIVASIRQGLPLAKQDILKYLDDWDLIPVEMDGRYAATVIAKGTEIHIALVEGYRPKSSQRRAIHGFLKPLFERHEFLTTRVPHHRLKQKKFVQRVGFKPTWKDENFEYYMLASMPFERKH